MWNPVRRNIPFDLESTPLQIKTDSTTGSEEMIYLLPFKEDGSSIGAVGVKFTSPIQYAISNCANSWTDLTSSPPEEVDKIWTIQKTISALIIYCNGVEVLYYKFKGSSDSRCVPRWGGDVVESILFNSGDSASDNYRPAGNKGSWVIQH